MNRTATTYVLSLLVTVLVGAWLVGCQPTPTPPAPEPATITTGCAPGEIQMVVLDAADVAALSVVEEIPQIGVRVVCANPAARVALEQVANAYPAQPVYLIEPSREPGDLPAVQAEERLWGMEKVEARAGWPVTRGKGATIAVIDTGVDCTVPDLAGRCTFKKDYVGGSGRHPHGTHVAGTAAGADNGSGVYGVAPEALITDYRVLDASGSGSEVGVAAAIVQAADDGATALNLSLGGGPSAAMDRAVEYAQAVGAIVVAAAGNSNTDAPSSPGCAPFAVGVGATTQTDGKADFSNYGRCVDLGAPGVGITSVVPGGRLETWSGTSMATPHVAGAAALLRAAGVPARDVLAALRTGDPGPANLGGVRLNVRKALAAPPPEPPTAGPSPTIGPIPPTATKPPPYPGPTRTPVKTATPRAGTCESVGLLTKRSSLIGYYCAPR